ncbi:MAG: HPr kinase/phosphorylase [Chakrabartia sp.]
MSDDLLLHASCVALNGRAVLLIGPSGAGKSDLALRLMDRGAQLVGDDYVLVRRDEDRVVARPAEKLQGLVEVRHIGICRFPFLDAAPLALVAELVDAPDRLPEPTRHSILGVDLPLIRVSALHASTPIKIGLALEQGTEFL